MAEIGADECMKLLATRRVGRLAFVVDGQPLVFPVNYAVDNGSVVFRTDRGSKLTNAPMSKVAFEVDDINEETIEGWDVVVQGHADDITGSIDERSEALKHIVIEPFAPGLKWHWIRIVPTMVTGRRLFSR